MARERIQKILARAGSGSRRDAEELLRNGLVTVNGTVVGLGDSADPAIDSIKVDGKRIRLPGAYRYLLLHKPSGVVSTTEDPEGRPTVIGLMPAGLRKGLKPVGRLDFDTEGLILLTDDGDFAQRVAHPRYGSAKTYEVKVKGHPDPEALDRLRRGMVIDGRRTGPIEVHLLKVSKVRKVPGTRRPKTGAGDAPREPNSWWTVVLREGRNRQIREMFFRVGHPVQRLRRIAIGPIKDTKLPRGEWRELTPEEVEALRSKPQEAPPPPPGPRPRKGAAKPRATAEGAARSTKPRATAEGGARPTKAPARRRSSGGPRPKGPAPDPARHAPHKPTAFDKFRPKADRSRPAGDDWDLEGSSRPRRRPSSPTPSPRPNNRPGPSSGGKGRAPKGPRGGKR